MFTIHHQPQDQWDAECALCDWSASCPDPLDADAAEADHYLTHHA